MMSSETLAVTYGIGSAVAWGAGDFSGGFASRKGNLFGVLLISQTLGGVLLALFALLLETAPPASHFYYGACAGACGCMGLMTFYKGLAEGRMGIVAPMSAVLTALVPIGYAVFNEGLPSVYQITGIVCVLVAIWLLSAADTTLRITRKELILSTVAGFGFGLFFIFIDRANDLTVFWPLAGARCVSVTILAMMVAIDGKGAKPLKGQWVFIWLCGILDAAGNALFSMAAQLGRLDISAVLGSLYPAATVILAWFILKERLGLQQWAGVGTAFVALILISM